MTPAVEIPNTVGAEDDWNITTLDGALLPVRVLQAADYDDVVRLAETLTERERYLRFFTTHPNYLDEWARSQAGSGDGGRATVGAFEDDALVGLAGYVATAEPGCAEVSVVVAHDQHDRGIGTGLLDILALLARTEGFHHLVADVLCENRSMQRVIADAGWPCTFRQDGFVATYDVDLDRVTPC